MKKLLMLLTFGRIQSRLGKPKTSFVLRSLLLHLTMLSSTASFAACSSDSSEPLGAEDNAAEASVKTLVVYYSYTNNCETVVNDLRTQISCDVLEIEPKEKGLKYEANNYAIGSEQLSKINANPNDLSSYPEIDPVSLKGLPDGSSVSISQYDCILIAVPLWWSQMATPMQSFLFQYGGQMAGKHIGMIVSSASSGISGVVSRAKELIPEGQFFEKSLWVRSSQVSNCHALTAQWLQDINFANLQPTGISQTKANSRTNGKAYMLNGQLAQADSRGVIIQNGKKRTEIHSKSLK